MFRGLVLVDTGRNRVPKVKNPEGLAIRIMSNGAVYPSKDLVDKFNLEYRSAPIDEEEQKDYDKGFGFDVVDSLEWEPTKNLPRVILLGHTSKSNPKVDLFSSTVYNNGVPRSSVLSQGTVSKELLELVRALGYLNPDQKYVDLVFTNVDNPITTSDGLSWIPKVIERGVNKGERDSQRRENSKYYVVVSSDAIQQLAEPQTGAVVAAQPTTN